MALSPNLRGALFMAVSMAGFTINDTFVKLASAELNAGQIMFVRGLMATFMLWDLCWRTGALRPPRMLLNKAVFGRSAFEMLATVTFLTGLAHMPIGNASAILQALPLAVTMGAALFLGEPVGWRRWAAILAGFIGVIIIVRPGAEGFNAWALLILACVVFAAARDLVTKSAPSEIRSSFLSMSTAMLITLAGLILIVPFGGWVPLSLKSFTWLAAASFFILFGYQYIIQSMRTGEVGFIAPFRYTSLLWAIGLGFLVFGDVPDTWMIVGSMIVVASGVYTFHRERIRARTVVSREALP